MKPDWVYLPDQGVAVNLALVMAIGFHKEGDEWHATIMYAEQHLADVRVHGEDARVLRRMLVTYD